MLDELVESSFRGQFAGHETFPLRLLWLKKAHDAVRANPRTFHEQDAIARFGVGRNMVLAIRHWALAAGILRDSPAGLAPTPIGDLLFAEDTGLDPYLEDPSTAWWVHFRFAGSPEQTTTFFYAFNGLSQPVFDRAALVRGLAEWGEGKRSWRLSPSTLKRDVEVFVRSYVSTGNGEDAAEPLLAELNVVRESGIPGRFEFSRGPKPTLADGIFAVALRSFWRRWHRDSPTLTLEQACYAPGSPGRVFKLDEESVHERLSRIDGTTAGALAWTDTAGLRQVIFREEIDDLALLRSAYRSSRGKP